MSVNKHPVETRNPKSEGRKKAEIRRPNETVFGRPGRFRISAFGLLSGFGLRVSDFGFAFNTSL
jgi:hypothetical protein